ncbi:hypothetical protein LCGC14_1030470 [marine sediment metagenome]|uniref:Uncharacterized protein n=1 Tax=marine sediment metagenome TaxID=412755 RepID=A0A0F9QCT6_9ZZZZ
MTLPTVGDPLPVTLGELHDLGDHSGSLLAITITDAGGLDITWTAGMLRTPTGDIVLTVAGSATCTDDAVNFLKWTSGNSLVVATTDATHDSEVPIGHIACQNGDIWDVHTDPVSRAVTTDIQHGLEEIFPLAVSSGCLVSEDTDATDPLDVTISSGAYLHDLHDEHTVTGFDSRTANTLIRCFIDGSGPETWDFTADGAQSEIDVGNWNSGTSLIGTSVGKYYKGLFVISERNIFWIYAQAEHNTVAQAIDGVLPSIPPGLDNFPRSVAYIYKHGDTAFEPATSDRWMDARPLVPGSVPAGPITDHGELVGLAPDDDHTQYLLLAGRSGGQIINGGTDASDDLTLKATAHATQGFIHFGSEVDAGAHTIGFTLQTATGDGTTTIDWRLGNHFKFTWGAQDETFTFTAPSNVGHLTLEMKQDGTGGRDATLSMITWLGTVPVFPDGGANKTMFALIFYDGTTYWGQITDWET